MPRRKRKLIQEDENCMFKGWDEYEGEYFKLKNYKRIINRFESERRLYEKVPSVFKIKFCETLEEIYLKARIEEVVNEFPCFTTDIRRAAEFISEFSYDSDDDNSEVSYSDEIDDGMNGWSPVNEITSESNKISIHGEDVSIDSDDSFGFDNSDDASNDVYSDLKPIENMEISKNERYKSVEVNNSGTSYKLAKIPIVVLSKMNINNQIDEGNSSLLDSSVVRRPNENDHSRKRSINTTQTYQSPINTRLRNKDMTQLVESENNSSLSSPKKINNTSSLIPNLIIQMEKWKYFSDSFFNTMRKTTSDSQLISSLEREFYCDYCKRAFLQKSSMKKHILICSKRPDRLILAKATKEKIKSSEFECKKCKKYFSSKFTQLRHFEMRHNLLKTFKCLLCRWGFFNEQALQFHCVKRHGLAASKPYNCAYCKEKFYRRGELNFHCRRSHNSRLYVCSVCLKTFKSDVMCKKHEKSHGYKCEVCIFTTQSEIKMAEHKQAHVVQVVVFNCEICSRKFNRRNDLKRHIKVHERERRK